MNTGAPAHIGFRPVLVFAALAACAVLFITGCAAKPEVVIVNDTPIAIKADVQLPVTTTLNGYPIPGARTQTIVGPGEQARASSGVDVASRKVWLRVVCVSIADASLISPAVDPAGFSFDGRGSKVVLTLSVEGRTVRAVAVDEAGTTLNLMAFPPESPRPPDPRQPVFDSIGIPGGDVR